MIQNRMPKYVQSFLDRTGKPRFYYRRPKYRVPLPGVPYTPTFMAAYQEAENNYSQQSSVDEIKGLDRLKPGSFDALIASYYSSTEFQNLKSITQSTYRNRIEAFRKLHGHRTIAGLQRKHVRALMDQETTPDKSNRLLKTLRILTRHALNRDLITADPCHKIQKLKIQTDGFLAWSEEHIRQFYLIHKEGTRARLAIDLLLHTGQRRQDIVALGPKNVVGNQLRIQQSKTGSIVSIPLHGPLCSIVENTDREQQTFLTGASGKPFTPESFTNWFRKCVVASDLPKGLSPHGLRKAVCRRLAEAGCSEHEIMAISGHKNIKEVSLYTRSADRTLLAKRAMNAMEFSFPAQTPTLGSVKPDAGI